jgi:hypothetical protein
MHALDANATILNVEDALSSPISEECPMKTNEMLQKMRKLASRPTAGNAQARGVMARALSEVELRHVTGGGNPDDLQNHVSPRP